MFCWPLPCWWFLGAACSSCFRLSSQLKGSWLVQEYQDQLIGAFSELKSQRSSCLARLTYKWFDETLLLCLLAIHNSDKPQDFFLVSLHLSYTAVLIGCRTEQVRVGCSLQGNKCAFLSVPLEQLSADPKTRKWSKTLVYKVSKSNERSILRWKLGRTMGVGGNTTLHRGIPIGGWYGKKGGGDPHISSRQREGINEAIKACSLRSIVGGRAG